MVQTSPEDEYCLDELGRIRPVHQMGWAKERWDNVPSFDEALQGVASLALIDALPAGGRGVSQEDLDDLKAKRYLDIVDGFFLASGVDVRYGVYRFTWQGEEFFTMRPDFFLKSLANDIGEPPVNIIETTIRDSLLDYGRQLEALKYARANGELNPNQLHTIEWWIDFWTVRGIAVLGHENSRQHAAEKPLNTNERNTLLTIIAALCAESAIDWKARGAGEEIARLTEKIGAPVSGDSVRRTLGRISDALESRMK